MSKKIFIILIFSLLILGCSMNQKIQYKTDDIVSAEQSPLYNIVLDIQELEDLRKSIDENNVLFSEGRKTKINGRGVCINSEEHYAEGTATAQISKIIAEHFTRRGIFKSVTFNSKEKADYYLTGNLKRFYAEQKSSLKAEIGSQFGIIGALAIAGLKTSGIIKIEVSNLVLHNKTGDAIKQLDDISMNFEDEFSIDPYCWSPYWNINDKLKVFVSKLIESVEQEIKRQIALKG
jgi:hypothetical protein